MKYLILVFSLFFSLNAFCEIKAPVKTVVGTGSYTVPAGRWARVVVDCNAAAASYNNATGTASYGEGASTAVSKSFEYFLKSGDALTVSKTAASGTLTMSATQAVPNGGSSSSVVSISINGTIVSSCRAITAFSGAGYSTGASSASYTGVADFGYLASEYFN